jgi:hypothetical protein
MTLEDGDGEVFDGKRYRKEFAAHLYRYSIDKTRDWLTGHETLRVELLRFKRTFPNAIFYRV